MEWSISSSATFGLSHPQFLALKSSEPVQVFWRKTEGIAAQGACVAWNARFEDFRQPREWSVRIHKASQSVGSERRGGYEVRSATLSRRYYRLSSTAAICPIR